MKFDLSQFNDLDMENIGGWPTQVKTVFAIILAILVFAGGYYFFI
nr:pilus assembly protein PilP [Shewanella shenzhenensis]